MDTHADIEADLQRAATQYHRATAQRKEAQENALAPADYHALQRHLNSTKFLAPLDADTTKFSIEAMKRRFERFCIEKQHGNWETTIERNNCDKGLIMTFLRWICVSARQRRRKDPKKKSINQYWRDFKMLYLRQNKGRFVKPKDCVEIRKYINTALKEEFGLDDQPGSKPVMNVDDLLLGLTHHWSRDRSIFPTEDDRLDFPTIMLFQAYTACRPAELVDGAKGRKSAGPKLEGSDLEKAKSSEQPEHDNMAHGYMLPPCNPGVSSGKMAQKQRATTMSSYESESESDADYGLDDSVFDSGDESHGRETEGDGYETSDTGYSDDGEEDVGMLPPEPELPRPTTGMEEGEDQKKVRLHKALCYEDIVLWIVRDPRGGGRDVLAMEVFFRHHKGVDNKPKPTAFLFRENPLPMLCPISHILARAIRDKAFDVDGISHAAPFFSTRIGRQATKVNWKRSILKTPVFRRSVRTETGGWEKSTKDPMPYHTYAHYINRMGQQLGSEEKWTSYCMRRGNANALLKVAPSSIVDQVMRHDPMTGCLANAYLNLRVGFNTQDAYLEKDPSADGLTKAFSHMSIRCNPEVPQEIPKNMLAKLSPDPAVIELDRKIRQKATHLRRQYKYIKLASEEEKEDYMDLRRDLRNAKKKFKVDMTKAYQAAYRRRMHNDVLERQLNGIAMEERVEPTVEHQLPERTCLQNILCDFSTDMGVEAMTARKIQAIDAMVRLAACREVRRPRPAARGEATSKVAVSKLILNSEPSEDIPLQLRETQCIICVGDERLPPATRMRDFSRVEHMKTHVQEVHLQRQKNNGKFTCYHPKCRHLGDFLPNSDQFKAHVQTVHGMRLR